MRSIVAIIVGFIVAVLLAFLGCLFVGELDGAPHWLCTALYIVAILAWLWWAFGGYLEGRRGRV
jgi:hypothetical protein